MHFANNVYNIENTMLHHCTLNIEWWFIFDCRYFCRLNASEAAPPYDGEVSGGRCTAGHYCPQGTAEPIPCADGTYMEDRQAAECLLCPQGRFCVTGLTPELCPAGFFCVNGKCRDNWSLSYQTTDLIHLYVCIALIYLMKLLLHNLEELSSLVQLYTQKLKRALAQLWWHFIHLSSTTLLVDVV